MTAAYPTFVASKIPDRATATDDELIAAYNDSWGLDREDAVEELYRRHHRRIVSWCYRFTRDRELALDLAQEIFLRAFRNLAGYRGQCRFSTWLYVIARNLCMTALQKRAAEPVWAAKAIPADLPDRTSFDVHSNLEMEQIRERSWKLILATLNRTEAKVLSLHYGHELPLDTVSRMLNLTNKSGAKAYIVSARRKIADAKLNTDSSRSRARLHAVAGKAKEL